MCIFPIPSKEIRMKFLFTIYTCSFHTFTLQINKTWSKRNTVLNEELFIIWIYKRIFYRKSPRSRSMSFTLNSKLIISYKSSIIFQAFFRRNLYITDSFLNITDYFQIIMCTFSFVYILINILKYTKVWIAIVVVFVNWLQSLIVRLFLGVFVWHHHCDQWMGRFSSLSR